MRVQYGTMGYVLCNIYIYTPIDIVLPEIGDEKTPIYSSLCNIMFNIVKNHDMGPGTWAIVRAAGADIFRPCLMTPEGFFRPCFSPKNPQTD
jgi:hypothetical protein